MRRFEPRRLDQNGIRAHFAPFLHASDFGYLRFRKLSRLRIGKRSLCNPSARFGRRYFYPLNQVRQTKNLQDKKLENVMFSVFFVPYTTICRASGESNRQKNFWNTMGATGDRNTGKTEVLNERHKQCSVSPKRGCQYHIVSALKYLMLIR